MAGHEARDNATTWLAQSSALCRQNMHDQPRSTRGTHRGTVLLAWQRKVVEFRGVIAVQDLLVRSFCRLISAICRAAIAAASANAAVATAATAKLAADADTTTDCGPHRCNNSVTSAGVFVQRGALGNSTGLRHRASWREKCVAIVPAQLPIRDFANRQRAKE